MLASALSSSHASAIQPGNEAFSSAGRMGAINYLDRVGDAFRLRVLVVSLLSPLFTQVLHNREVTLSLCCISQWCPTIFIHRILVSDLLAEVLHHREVTIVCCPAQWSPASTIPRLQIHLRSLHHSHHYLQPSSSTCLNKATIVGQVHGLITTAPGISQAGVEVKDSLWHSREEYMASTIYVNLLHIVPATRTWSR